MRFCKGSILILRKKNDRLDEIIIANFNRILIWTIIKSSTPAQIWIIICQKLKYCGIINVHKGPMFMAFVSYHCTQINIPTNVCTSIYLVLVCKIEPATYEITSPRTKKCCLTTSIHPNKTDSTVKVSMHYLSS